MLVCVHVSGPNRRSYHADHQKVSRCHESKVFIACKGVHDGHLRLHQKFKTGINGLRKGLMSSKNIDL